MLRTLCLLFVSACLALSAAASTKRALIVGVGEYRELPDLQKTTGDANGYAEVFGEDLGFEVTRLIDPTRVEFLQALNDFLQSIEPGDEVAFVFSGHGWSNESDNFLALSDAPLQSSEFALQYETVSLSKAVLAEIRARKPGLLFAIIDACRDNPFDTGTRSVTRGLTRLEVVPGTLVVYAAGTRQKALDRLGPDDASPYSVFTRSLLPKLKDPSRPLLRSVDEARDEVSELAGRINHSQRPAIYSDVSLDFCFVGPCQTGAGPGLDRETQEWIDITTAAGTDAETCAKYQLYLTTHGETGRFAAVARYELSREACSGAAQPQAPEVSDPENWRAVPSENLFVFETTKGRVLVEAFPEFAPQTVTRMREAIRNRFYDGTHFHRVLKDFLAQTGDVQAELGIRVPTIPGEPMFTYDPETMTSTFLTKGVMSMKQGLYKGMPVTLATSDGVDPAAAGEIQAWGMNCAGTVAMARARDPDSATTQFYFILSAQPQLDRAYAVWGRVLDGMDALYALKASDLPDEQDRITKAFVAADMPARERPVVAVQRDDGPNYRLSVASSSGKSPCEMPALAVDVR